MLILTAEMFLVNTCVQLEESCVKWRIRSSVSSPVKSQLSSVILIKQSRPFSEINISIGIDCFGSHFKSAVASFFLYFTMRITYLCILKFNLLVLIFVYLRFVKSLEVLLRKFRITFKSSHKNFL